jgi:hypothetical protein
MRTENFSLRPESPKADPFAYSLSPESISPPILFCSGILPHFKVEFPLIRLMETNFTIMGVAMVVEGTES